MILVTPANWNRQNAPFFDFKSIPVQVTKYSTLLC